MFNISFNVFDTHCNSYFNIQVKYFKNLLLNLLYICMFLDTHIIHGNVAKNKCGMHASE